MSNEAKHTPIPWRVLGIDQTSIVPVSAPIPWICTMEKYATEDRLPQSQWRADFYNAEQKANAAFIVEAVNAHDSLKAEKEELVSILETMISLVDAGFTPAANEWDEARSAIAKASN